MNNATTSKINCPLCSAAAFDPSWLAEKRRQATRRQGEICTLFRGLKPHVYRQKVALRRTGKQVRWFNNQGQLGGGMSAAFEDCRGILFRASSFFLVGWRRDDGAHGSDAPCPGYAPWPKPRQNPRFASPHRPVGALDAPAIRTLRSLSLPEAGGIQTETFALRRVMRERYGKKCSPLHFPRPLPCHGAECASPC